MRNLLLSLMLVLASSPALAVTAIKSYTANGSSAYTVQSTDTAWSQLLKLDGASSCAVQTNLNASETFTLTPRASNATAPDPNAVGALTLSQSGAFTFTPGQDYFSVRFDVLGNSQSLVGIVCDPAGGADADLSMDLSTITFPAGGGGATSINDLTDVDITGVTTWQLLSWNGTNWVPADDADTIYDDTALQGQVDNIPVIDALGDIADVDLATAAPTTDQLLSFDGTNWVPADSPAADKLIGDWPASSTENIYPLTSIQFGDGYRDMIETTLLSPKWVSGLKVEPLFNLDGEKAYCAAGPGLGSDPNKPWYTCPDSSTRKTKSNGLYLQMVNLSPGEAHAIHTEMITGGDTDPNGMQLKVLASGGSQTGGDEGINGIRLVTNVNWGASFGTISEALPAATGVDVSVGITGVSEYETNFVGVGKMFVLSGSPEAFTVTLADQTSSSPERPKQTVLKGFANNGGVRGPFLLDSDLPADVEAGNWCMYDPANDYFAGGTGPADTHFWLLISEVARSTDAGNPAPSFTTTWRTQSVDNKYPNYLMWSGEYHFAPCYTITKVEQDPATKVTNRVYLHKTVNHTELSGTSWEVTPYGEIKQTGVKVLQTANINPAYSGAAFTAVHEIGAAFGGRYQLPSALSVEHSGGSCVTADRATSCIEDGRFGAFGSGMEISEWAAQLGTLYRYPDADSSAGFALAQIRPTTGQGGLNWGLTGSTGRFHTVIDVYQHANKSLILNGTYGWGVGRTGTKWFPLISTATVTGHTDGSFLKWSAADSAYVEGVPALGDLGNVSAPSPTAGNLLGWSGAAWINTTQMPPLVGHTDVTMSASPIPVGVTLVRNGSFQWVDTPLRVDLNDTATDVTITSPTAGQVLSYDGLGWVNAAAGGTNNSFSNFQAIGAGEAALFSGSGTMSAWNASYTAFAFAGATYTVSLPEIANTTADVHSRVEIWVQPGVTLTVQGHANDTTALEFNFVTTGAGTASMTFTAPASDIACKVEVFVRAANEVMTSSTCPTQTLSNPN